PRFRLNSATGSNTTPSLAPRANETSLLPLEREDVRRVVFLALELLGPFLAGGGNADFQRVAVQLVVSVLVLALVVADFDLEVDRLRLLRRIERERPLFIDVVFEFLRVLVALENQFDVQLLDLFARRLHALVDHGSCFPRSLNQLLVLLGVVR